MTSPANRLWQAIERFVETAGAGGDVAETETLVIRSLDEWREARPTDWSEAYEELETALSAIQMLGRRASPYPPASESTRVRLTALAAQAFNEKLVRCLE
jgi:hypothetical protein